jgi:hypothetical protein
MATVSVSENITHHECTQRAEHLAQAWQEGLTGLGIHGGFRIEHGNSWTCEATHGLTFNGGFYIVTEPRGCNVFVTLAGNPSDFVGASRVDLNRYAGPGRCHCGHDH